MTVIDTSTASTATANSNQRKVDRCQNGVLWAAFWDGTSTTSTSIDFAHSSDDGTTWTVGSPTGFAGAASTYTPNFSFFIDLDDYCHLAYKDRSDGFIYYRRGTPNAARTAWTWSAAVIVGNNTSLDHPDVVAHREGSGWKAHVVMWESAGSNKTDYTPVTITSDGSSTAGTRVSIGGSYSTTASTYPSLDFNHTGDGKTVAGGTPHLYAAWSAGTTGAGKGIRFRKAAYSGGSWTWGTEREIDSSIYADGARWLNCVFDGTSALIGGYCRDASVSHQFLYERDAADTATATLVPKTQRGLASGCLTYDHNRDVYWAAQAGSSELRLWKWTRSDGSQAFVSGFPKVISATAPYVSAKRGFSNNRIELVYTDGTASPYTVTYDSISLNTAPNAPTTLSPAGSTTIDKDITQRFSWVFSDPDSGDSQSAYDLRYRLVGAGTWTTVSGGATQYHDFAGGTFAADDYEWEVRTYDATGEVGPYSATATFTAASTPATPTITAPTSGGTISTENYTVEWSASSQEKYQVRTVADAAGSPDTGTVYQDTGTVTSSSARARTMAFDTNLRTEHVQVRVQVAGLWSAWASVSVNVSYTLPPTPTLVATSSDATASITIVITNPAPSGSEPTVVGNDVWVRVAAGGRKDIDRPVGGDGVRLSSNTANGGTFVDRAPRANTEYEYRVRAQGDNDVSAWSAWTPVS